MTVDYAYLYGAFVLFVVDGDAATRLAAVGTHTSTHSSFVTRVATARVTKTLARVPHFVGASLSGSFLPPPRCASDTIVYRSGSFLEFSFSRTRISRARKSRSNGGVSG